MNKPGWFELTENDAPRPRRDVKRGFRSLALAIPLLAIGVGVVAAQTSNESPATAEETTLAVASAAPSVTPSITSNVAPVKPSIGTPPLPPTGGDDDDEYENDDEEDDD
jgi:hypothetical protein